MHIDSPRFSLSVPDRWSMLPLIPVDVISKCGWYFHARRIRYAMILALAYELFETALWAAFRVPYLRLLGRICRQSSHQFWGRYSQTAMQHGINPSRKCDVSVELSFAEFFPHIPCSQHDLWSLRRWYSSSCGRVHLDSFSKTHLSGARVQTYHLEPHLLFWALNRSLGSLLNSLLLYPKHVVTSLPNLCQTLYTRLHKVCLSSGRVKSPGHISVLLLKESCLVS